jgi:hypothetical protein
MFSQLEESRREEGSDEGERRRLVMKRSEINTIMREGDAFIRSFGFRLPPFAWLTPGEMQARRREIIDARLGWDITDYGQERFSELGLFLFTLRNGRQDDLIRGRSRNVLRGEAAYLPPGSAVADA